MKIVNFLKGFLTYEILDINFTGLNLANSTVKSMFQG